MGKSVGACGFGGCNSIKIFSYGVELQLKNSYTVISAIHSSGTRAERSGYVRVHRVQGPVSFADGGTEEACF